MTADYNALTSKQKKVFAAIQTYIRSSGIPPTVREIGEMVGEKTPGAVQGILNRLEMKGVIKRQMGMARSIRLIEKDTMYTKHVYIPLIKKITRRNIDDILNIYNIECYFPLPATLFENTDGLFIVSNPDKSLPESQIALNEYLIIRITDNISDGDIVMAMYENLVLLRQYRKEADTVFLSSEDSIVGKDRFDPEELVIVGKLAGKIDICR